MDSGLVIPKDMRICWSDLKLRIRSARLQAALTVNRELIRLYWEIGQSILERQSPEGGAPRSSSDWRKTCAASCPTSRGLSRANLFACGRSPRHTGTRQLSSSLLDNDLGSTT